MYVVEINDEDDGDPAEFVVADPVVALDLALRSQRAGLCWLVHEDHRVLALEDLRHRARRRAADDPTSSEQLHQAEREHHAGVRAALN